MLFRVPSHTVFREIDGQAIALNLDTGQYYTMNELGTRIWTLFQQEDSLAGIVKAIESEYDVTHEQAEADLESFLKDLRQNGLVEPL